MEKRCVKEEEILRKIQMRISSLLMTFILAITLLPTAAMAGSYPDCSAPDCSHQAAIGQTHYDTLAEAVEAAAAESDTTVQLLQDVELTENLFIRTGITLDLNGHDITGSRLLVSGGTESAPVTITDNQATSFSDAGTISAIQGLGVNGGSVVLRHIKLVGGGQAVEVPWGSSGVSLLLDGVNITVSSSTSLVQGINIGSAAQITVQPGTDDFPTTVSVTTTSTSGGAQASIVYASNFSGTTRIEGGTFSADAGQGTGYIFAGTAPCEIQNGSFDLNGTSCSVSYSYNSKVNVYGGRFNFEPVHLVQGYIAVKDSDPTYPWQVQKQPAAQVGDAQYDTLQQAIDAAGPDDTIILLANVTETNPLTFSKNVTIDDSDGKGGTYQLTLQGAPAVRVAKGVTLPAQISLDSFEASSDAGNGMTAYYLTFEQAVNGSSNVKLLKNATVESSVNKTTDLVVDLNGYDLTSKAEYAFSFAGTVMPGEAEIVLKNSGDEIAHINGGIELGQLGRKTAYTLTIEQGVAVSGEAPLLVSGEVTANIYGTLQVDADKAGTATEAVAGIQGNGSSGYEGTVVNIYDGAVVDGGEYVGIYHPQAGTLNIYGGTITGGSGIYVRSGTVNISGGTITGTAASKEPSEDTSAYPTGNALVLYNSGYVGGEPVVSVTGGTFSSTDKDANPVGSYGKDQIQPVTHFISGGTFSGTLASSYLAEGYVAVSNSSDPGKIEVEKPTYDDAEVETATVVGEPETSVGEEIKNSQDVSDAQSVASTVAESGSNVLETAADTVDQSRNADTAITELDKADVITLVNGAVPEDTTVTIVTQPYFDITATEYDVDANTPDSNAITFDVTPMYRTIATTADVKAGESIHLTDQSGAKNAVVLGKPQPLKISGSVQMTLDLPAGFFGSNPAEPLTAYVTHTKGNGSVYVYDAEVTAKAAPDSGYTATFTNPNGFSSLRITTNQPVATNGTNTYFDLQTAINETKAGGTITLLDEISVDNTLVINKNLTIDLNQHTITGESGENGRRALWVKSGTLELTGSGTITTANGNDSTFAKSSSVIRVGYDEHAAGLVVGENVKVIAPASYGITIFGTGTKTYTLDVHGTVEVTDSQEKAESAIAGNGSTGGAPTEITINPGAVVKAANNVAIYHPQNGTLTVSGGEISGKGGIQMCAGTLTVTGGTISGTGIYETINTYDRGGDGPILDGAAVSIVDRGYPQGTPSASLKGGVFTAADPDGAIQAYSWKNAASSDWDETDKPAAVSNGQFSSPVNPDYLDASLTTQLKQATNFGALYSYYSSLSAAMAVAGPNDEIEMLSDDPLFTVQFRGNGGTSAATLQVTAGTEITLPDSSRSGYTFQGWNDGAKTYVPGTTAVIQKNTIFTALWEKNVVPSTPSSSDSDDSGYSVSVPASSSIQGGSITVSPRSAEKGDTVTITVKPDDGYVLDHLTVTTRSGGNVSLTRKNDSQYTFRMPDGSVKIEVSFAKEGSMAEKEMSFSDVPANFWAYSEIAWSYENGYMGGISTTTFNPNGTVTRQQVWMILARLSGADPVNMAGAKAWAIANGVSDGTNPGNPVTRQQFAAMLYRYAVSNGMAAVTMEENLSGYPDAANVSSYAVQAMNWAVGQGIIGGTTAGTLNPGGPSTRAQTAVMLYRWLV